MPSMYVFYDVLGYRRPPCKTVREFIPEFTQQSSQIHRQFVHNPSRIHPNPSKMPPETDFRKRSRKRTAMGPTMELQEGHFWRPFSLINQKMFQMEPKGSQKSGKRACKKCYKSRCRTKIKNGAKRFPK